MKWLGRAIYPDPPRVGKPIISRACCGVAGERPNSPVIGAALPGPG
ncbi:MAG: hypothetical protein KAW89_09645 [Armatimonadetes bacterium]|nr:hypothetical protein [Armatimonadota bacterium]